MEALESACDGPSESGHPLNDPAECGNLATTQGATD